MRPRTERELTGSVPARTLGLPSPVREVVQELVQQEPMQHSSLPAHSQRGRQ
jgi:hypothetical protein